MTVIQDWDEFLCKAVNKSDPLLLVLPRLISQQETGFT